MKMNRAPAKPEPARILPAGQAEPEPGLSKHPYKKAIYWMFDELDVNPLDRRLSKREIRPFLMVQYMCTFFWFRSKCIPCR